MVSQHSSFVSREDREAAGQLRTAVAGGTGPVALFVELCGDDLEEFLGRPVDVDVSHVAHATAAAYDIDEAEVWSAVAGLGIVLVTGAVAWSPTTPPSVLARLADHPHGYVGEGVAANRSTPPSVLARLGGVYSEQVASNPAAPLTTLRHLAQHPKGAVPAALRANPTARLAGIEAVEPAAEPRCVSQGCERHSTAYGAVTVCRIPATVS